MDLLKTKRSGRPAGGGSEGSRPAPGRTGVPGTTPAGCRSGLGLASVVALLAGFILLSTLGGGAIEQGLAAESQTARTLIIRPDLLPAGVLGSQAGLLPARNPFTWSPAQLARFARAAGAAQPDPFTKLKLNGIIWTAEKPMVIINNRQLKTGDRIEGITVAQITKEAVILVSGNTKRIVQFPTPLIKLSQGAEGD